MVKRNRNYELSIQKNNGDFLVIRPPFTVEFDILRNTLSSANVASIRIYNLSEENRSEMRKDVTDFGRRKDITFKAGYEENLSIILAGQVSQGWSVRESVNFITQLECFDGGYGFMNSQVSSQYPANTTNQTVADDLVKSLSPYGIQKGAIGTVEGSIARGNSLSGNATDLLREKTGGNFFVDNSLAYVLAENEVIDTPIEVIKASTGLLGTPLREQVFTKIDVLFDPRFLLAQRVQLESATDKSFTGLYKIVGIHHRGTVSQVVSGEAVSTLTLLGGLNNIKVVQTRFRQ